jgi:hypothetical protein
MGSSFTVGTDVSAVWADSVADSSKSKYKNNLFLIIDGKVTKKGCKEQRILED